VPSDISTAARSCLGCGHLLPAPFLNLGRTPLANSYVLAGQANLPEEVFPLSVAYCGTCHLVQLTQLVPPEKLFTEYLYFSSYSETFVAHARAMAESLTERFNLGPASRVMEIASNDGYLLQFFKERDIPVLGIEPARNIAAKARERGIPTLECFFGMQAVEEICSKFGRADLIIGNNVLAHVPDIRGFLRAVAVCLRPDGAAVFEFPHVGEMLERTEFDTIYHEHVFYYSLNAIEGLAGRAGLELFDVAMQSVHGGSLRIFLQHPGTRPVADRIAATLHDEKTSGLLSSERYASFGQSVNALKTELVSLLRRLKASGKRLAAYGAPAKGNTLLNYCGIGTDLLEFTVDRSPHKQGLLLPGSRIPIRAPEALLGQRPDYAVILPWNIADEIVGQQQEYLRRGGKFILPIPRCQIIDASSILIGQ
jgi:SAM-dependent methyltransferase